MSEPAESAAGSTEQAWEHLHEAVPPELRRWLETGKAVALHQDLLMVAVPNNFTRNQLEGRFRSVLESELTTFFGRPIQLAVIVDESGAIRGAISIAGLREQVLAIADQAGAELLAAARSIGESLPR